MAVRIVTDSTCDIPPETVHELSITVVPLQILVRDTTYRDGVDLDSFSLCNDIKRSGHVPKTSVPPPGDFIAAYENLATDTDEILSIHLSSGYSSTYSVANLAAGYLEGRCRIEVLDSNSVSLGLGMMVTAAARAAQEGKTLDEVKGLVQHLTPRIRLFGKTDNFLYLLGAKRFRLTRWLIFTGKMGSPLNTKLLGEIYDGGKIRSAHIAIGEAMALNTFTRWARRFGRIDEIGIAYSQDLAEAENLAERIRQLAPGAPVVVTRLGCATSIYGGPDSVLLVLNGGHQ